MSYRSSLIGFELTARGQVVCAKALHEAEEHSTNLGGFAQAGINLCARGETRVTAEEKVILKLRRRGDRDLEESTEFLARFFR